MKLKADLKDWQIAREVFGKNTKSECHQIKVLRKTNYVLTLLCEGYFLLTTEIDEVGWLIPEDVVE